VEKLEVRLLLAAFMAVIIRISAKIPKAIIITVIDVRNLLPLIFFHDNERMSTNVIADNISKDNLRNFYLKKTF
jgi:hypothetical protein